MSAGGPIRVGIVGANAGRGWARDAHVPALKHLAEDFTIAAVSARTLPLAEEARVAFGAQRAFGESLDLVRDPDVDLVAVTVKVPEHRAIVLAALAAGKHVYCEWPLGREVAEAEEMAAAVAADSHAVIGLQGLSAPAVREAARLVGDGAIGKPMTARIFSPTAGWGAEAPPFYAYLQDKRNGATLETIAGGHTLAVIEAVIGAYVEVDARVSILRGHVRILGTDEPVERTSADHMMVLGLHGSGCRSTLEVAGGTASKPFHFEVTGETGFIRITGGFPGGFQAGDLVLETNVPHTAELTAGASSLKGPAINIAEGYKRLAADIRSGRRSAPDFGVAVALSRLLESIDRASETGRRQFLAAG
jgi:predicted dehydrogenase